MKNAMHKGAKFAHRFANRSNTPPIIFDDGKRPETLDSKASHQRAAWAHKWRGETAALHNQAVDCVAKLVKAHKREAEPGGWNNDVAAATSPPAIRKAAATFAKDTGIGPDHLEFIHIAALPLCALKELGEIIRDIVSHLAWPIQTYAAFTELIARKAGGTRATATCTSLYRLVIVFFTTPPRGGE